MEEPEQVFKVKVEFSEKEYNLLGNRLADVDYTDGIARYVHDLIMRSLRRKAALKKVKDVQDN